MTNFWTHRELKKILIITKIKPFKTKLGAVVFPAFGTRKRQRHKSYTTIAHYTKNYDNHFILQYCVQNTIKLYTTCDGTKIMLEMPNINLKIKDSYNFVQTQLSAFSETINLTELRKGCGENQLYVGPMPNKEYNSYDQMKAFE